MRVGNKGVFRFLLNKGVSVLATNDDGKTAVHAAIEIEKLEYLAYLFEADTVDVTDYSTIMENA
jgi:ankyrin repeat protein